MAFLVISVSFCSYSYLYKPQTYQYHIPVSLTIIYILDV